VSENIFAVIFGGVLEKEQICDDHKNGEAPEIIKLLWFKRSITSLVANGTIGKMVFPFSTLFSPAAAPPAAWSLIPLN
jgi:hypothetical protein